MSDVKINCGSSSGYSPYIADSYFSGGAAQDLGASPYTVDKSAVTAPAADSVYYSFRYVNAGSLTYTITGLTPGATKKVRIHTLENYYTSTGSRLFSATVNGTTWLTNYDAYGSAGSARYKATAPETTATVDGSGQIVIVVSSSTGGQICAIDVLDQLVITSASPLSNAFIGIAFSQNITATGGSGSVTYAEIGVTSGIPPGLSLSSGGLLSGTPTTAGVYNFTVQATDASGNSVSKSFALTVGTAPPLGYGFDRTGVELFCEAGQMSQANNSNVSSFTDQTSFGRHLTATTSQPTFQTAVVNSKPVVRFSGSGNPLTNNASFQVACGWILAKYTYGAFSGYPGLLSDLVGQSILVGNVGAIYWFDYAGNYYNPNGILFEYRLNDRIYPFAAAPGPMAAFKLLFFRFFKPITVQGISLGQDRTDTSRKWNGDVALMILCSRGFKETEISARSKAIADAYGLTLADVYPYQADRSGYNQTPAQSVNFYDPPDGERISETIGSSKRLLDLKFSTRRTIERNNMIAVHKSHYAAASPIIYRDYSVIPPEDIEGYFDSEYSLDGTVNDYSYGFKFREK